jgi:hypothetical protein
MMTDRRVRRTAETDLAIRFWLQGVAHRHGVRAVVLADDKGRLVSGAECLAYGGEQVATSIDKLFGRDLAAVGPIAYDDVCRTGETDWKAHGKPVRVASLEARSGRYFLVSIGDTVTAEPLEAEAVPGLLRILSSGGPLS